MAWITLLFVLIGWGCLLIVINEDQTAYHQMKVQEVVPTLIFWGIALFMMLMGWSF